MENSFTDRATAFCSLLDSVGAGGSVTGTILPALPNLECKRQITQAGAGHVPAHLPNAFQCCMWLTWRFGY